MAYQEQGHHTEAKKIDQIVKENPSVIKSGEFPKKCSWCVGRGCIPADPDKPYSHGACESCSRGMRQEFEAKQLQRKYGLPAFIVREIEQ